MGDNPFADPFADPSVTSAASTGGAYGDTFNNPFETQQRTSNAGSSGGAYGGKKNDKTALLPKRTQDVEMKARSPTHASSPASGGGLSEEDLRIREANLIRREQELAERERQVEEKARQNGNSKKDNWPSRCYPLEYHSIVDEIPEAQRTMVRQFYASVFFAWMCIFWNWLTMLIGWGSSIDDISGSDALWASIYLIIGIPGSWRLWYRSLYFAIRDRATGKWVVFFLSFLMHIGFAIVMGLGVPSCAAAGLFLMIKLFANKHSLLGIFCLVAMIIWGMSVLFSIYLLKRAHSLWKGGGGAAQLKKEVAKAAVTEAVNQKMAESGEATEEV